MRGIRRTSDNMTRLERAAVRAGSFGPMPPTPTPSVTTLLWQVYPLTPRTTGTRHFSAAAESLAMPSSRAICIACGAALAAPCTLMGGRLMPPTLKFVCARVCVCVCERA